MSTHKSDRKVNILDAKSKCPKCQATSDHLVIHWDSRHFGVYCDMCTFHEGLPECPECKRLVPIPPFTLHGQQSACTCVRCPDCHGLHDDCVCDDHDNCAVCNDQMLFNLSDWEQEEQEEYVALLHRMKGT